MKITILPSKGLFSLSIGAFLLPAGLLWGCIEERFWSSTVLEILIDVFNAPDVFSIIMVAIDIIISFAFIPFLIILFFYGALELFLFAGRPLKFSEDMVSIGYIKKKHYYKKNITGIGIATVIDGNLNREPVKNNVFMQNMNKMQGIYIVFGDYKKSDLSEYGIMTVWELVELHKILPKVVEFLHRVGPKYLNTDDTSNIQRCDGLVWMTYTEENFRFLQNWLGSKFDEVTQQ